MIITLAREGQMCNQLMTLAASLANGLETQENVVCPLADDELKRTFAFDASSLPIDVKMYHSRLYEIIAKLMKPIKRVFGDDAIRLCFRNTRVTVYMDWISFKDDVALYHHLDDVRSFFRVKPFISEKCFQKMAYVRTDNIPIVGVHVRRGDYKEFQDGKYYYSDHEFLRWMVELNKTRECKFVIISNEDIDISVYLQEGVRVEYIKGSAIEDLCYLSMCDYIMGPPSTYSWWASMYGNKQRLILEKRNEEYTWSDFRLLKDRLIEKTGGGITRLLGYLFTAISQWGWQYDI